MLVVLIYLEVCSRRGLDTPLALVIEVKGLLTRLVASVLLHPSQEPLMELPAAPLEFLSRLVLLLSALLIVKCEEDRL